MSYNVAGLKNKVKDNFFINFVCKYDIIILLETFIEEKDFALYKDSFLDYNLFWCPAVRTSSFGRASGGKVIGVKKGNENLQIKLLQNWVSVKITTSDRVVYLMPIYVNCSNWEEEYDELENFLNNNNDLSFILIGDWNGRIGINQGTLDETDKLVDNVVLGRNSKDKNKDGKGTKLLKLWADNNLIVLNGRVKGENLLFWVVEVIL